MAVEANPDYWSAMVGLGGALLIAMVLALRDFKPASRWAERLAPVAAYLLPFGVVAIGLYKLRTRANASAADEWAPGILIVACVWVLLGMMRARPKAQ